MQRAKHYAETHDEVKASLDILSVLAVLHLDINGTNRKYTSLSYMCKYSVHYLQ